MMRGIPVSSWCRKYGLAMYFLSRDSESCGIWPPQTNKDPQIVTFKNASSLHQALLGVPCRFRGGQVQMFKTSNSSYSKD